MSLIQRAIEFVETGHPKDEADLLRECIQAHDLDGLAAVQRLYEDMYGGFTFNFELKAPAAFCLLCWGESGIDALFEGLKRTPSSKNASLVMQIVSAVAAGTEPSFLFLPGNLAVQIREAVKDNSALASFARQRLTECMLSLKDDGEASEMAAIGFQRLSILDDNVKAAKEIFAALASRWLVVGQPTIERYRKLVAEFPEDERAFQSLFEEVPQLLDPLCSLVWPRPDLHGAKEPDFVLKGEEIPRLCRGGSSSLTFAGVHPRNSKREPTKAHAKEKLDGPIGESKPHGMGVQIPCGIYPEMPPQGAV